MTISAPRSLVALVLLAAFLSPASADAEEDLVWPRLIVEESAAVPGEVLHLGVSFDIEEGWHLYWRNAGESGAPIAIQLELPAGFEPAGEWQWPAPERLVLPGDLLNYVYEDRVTLLLPVRVDPSVAPGTVATIRAEVSWLVCQEICLDGEETIALEVPVADAPGEPTADAASFAEARARLPRAPAEDELQARWDERTLILDVPGAERLTFFPLAPEAIPPEDMLESGEVEGERIAIAYPARADDVTLVTGVLEVRRAEGRVDHLWIQAPARHPSK